MLVRPLEGLITRVSSCSMPRAAVGSIQSTKKGHRVPLMVAYKDISPPQMQMLRLIFVDSAERRLAPEAIELHDLLPPPRARTGADHGLAILHTGTNGTPFGCPRLLPHASEARTLPSVRAIRGISLMR